MQLFAVNYIVCVFKQATEADSTWPLVGGSEK